MKNIILEFDKRNVCIEEIQDHVNYYRETAEKGMKLYSEGNKKEAMLILKELRNSLKLEYGYYDKAKIMNVIYKNKYYRKYKEAVDNAYVKQNKPNAYEWLHSNLYDIYDYMGYCEISINNMKES